MENASELSCSANIEWLNPQGIVQRKLSHKSAFLRLIRSDAREMFIEVTSAKSAAVKLQLKGISVHKKFMNEGKASIKFQELRCTMYLSNAPPNQLLMFLRTIFVKMTGAKSTANPNTSLRTQILSNKPQQFEEISPVTSVEVDKAKAKVSKGTDTTPSPLSKKRKLSPREGGKAPASKKLYSSSPVPDEPLDLEQKEVMEACLSGRNVFFTGSAGTGKSYLLRRIIGALPPDVTSATASTGVAACHIGGITLHQFAGIGTGDATLERSIQLASRTGTATIWRKCKHLIIDEISMVDGSYFEKIETVARKIRRSEKPFGGIQLILCGDFFQLPPVTKNKIVQFCFQTEAWSNCRLSTYELKRVHRQNDDEFIKILNCVRLGRIPEHMAQRLIDTSKQKIEKNGILATRLCSHTGDANIINESKLEALPGDKQVFTAEDSDPHLAKQIDQQTSVPFKLELKVGAQVMLLKNISVSAGLVNGARGVVKSFHEGLPVVQFRNKELVAKHERWLVKTAGGATLARKQIPLKLAWAFSIHKSQGLTLDCVEMSLAKVFEAGQAYVALSRAQSLQTLRVLDFKATQVWANENVLGFYRALNLQMESMRLIPLGRKENGKKGVKRPFSCGSKAMSKPLVVIN